jgi:putative ABC transport system ATP-binding protein
MYILETRGLKKRFGEGDTVVEAVKGINLHVNAGEFVAIMGRSGSGKSTLLAMLGGVDVPSSGQVFIEERDMANMTDDERTLMRRRRIGFIFQSFNLLPILTAEENVALPLELDGLPTQEARTRAQKALDKVGMLQRLHHVPGKMSGGEQQRVAIARALVIQPALLLADEPTGNLDSSNSQRITKLLRDLVDKQQQTIVMVTHDASVAALADRVIHVVDGLVQSDTMNNGTIVTAEPVVPVKANAQPHSASKNKAKKRR